MEKKKEKNQKSRKIWIWLTLILIVVALIVIIWNFVNSPIDVRILETKFYVSDRGGFEINTTALTFGKLSPGGSSSKKVYVSNERNFSVRIEIFASENIAYLLSMEHEIILQPSENKTLGFNLYVPNNMSFGEYHGKVVLKTYKYGVKNGR